jgi:hypothetical protein
VFTRSSLSRWPYSPSFAADRSGNLIVPDWYNYVIWKRSPDDVWSVLAGKEGIPSADDGVGENARFGSLTAATTDQSGNIYVADLQQADGVPPRCVIRRISLDGAVTTVSGNLLKKSNLDELAVEYPDGIAIDSHGVFYLMYQADCTIWRVTAQGEAAIIGRSTLEMGSADGLGGAARFVWPKAIAMDAHDNLYVADGETTIRKGQLAGPPMITSQPQSVTVTPGTSVQFSVTASGVPAPTYQWLFNGAAIAGATGYSLSIPGARTSNAGQYTVIISNALGSVTSSAAMLTMSATANASSSGGSGGGAMGAWFVGLLAALVAARTLAGKS